MPEYPTDNSELEALLAALGPELSKYALRVLNEWGVSTPGADNFPVRLTLITRLNLWALARCGIALATERQAVSEMVSNLSLALSSEQETREVFLRQFRSEERGEAQRIHSLAQHIEALQVGFLQSLKDVARSMPDPGAIARLLEPRPSPDQEAFRQATARLVRAAEHFDERSAELGSAPVAPAVPPTPPEPAIQAPLVTQVPVPVLARPLAFAAVYLAAFSYAWVLHPGVGFSLALLATCALPAVVLTAFFLFCLVLYPR